MYRCMADCEETESKTREIPRCQAQCAENFVTPARKIIEAEVDRVNNMINFELDECIQTARGTIYADNFKEGIFSTASELTPAGKVTNKLSTSISLKMAERSEAKKREEKLLVKIS